jgi:hypothetical protein
MKRAVAHTQILGRAGDGWPGETLSVMSNDQFINNISFYARLKPLRLIGGASETFFPAAVTKSFVRVAQKKPKIPKKASDEQSVLRLRH